MSEVARTPAWLTYERCVAAFAVAKYGGLDIIVQPNVMLKGAISGEFRQIDVLIDYRWERSTASRIIVDAKQWARKVDIGDVERFEGMMRDCRASRGIIVCTKGYTKGALHRVQEAITITILSLDEIEEFGWLYEPCLGLCANPTEKKGYRGGVLWGEYLTPDVQGLWLIVQTGKCDGCHNFHVWCWDCGEKFAVPDNRIILCGCCRQWAAVPESPESGHVGEAESVWLMMREDNDLAHPPIVLDRRPLR